MKKLAAIFVLGVWVMIIMATFNVVAKSEDLKTSDFELYTRNVPVVCGEYENILVYLEYYDFEAIYTSVGKTGAHNSGEPVYAMIIYMNKAKTETISVMGVPYDSELCMMYRTFDLQEFSIKE